MEYIFDKKPELEELTLEHYGVKGMRWGVRKDRTSGVSRKVDRDAAKDAKEFEEARLFYGKGAGTRRKLIKAKVERKSSVVEGYKEAFDNHLSKQDSNKAADKAVTTRKRQDRSERNKQRAGAVARRLTGEFGTQAAFVAIAAGGIAYLNSPSGKRTMSKLMNTIGDTVNAQKQKRGADYLADYFKRNS